MILAHGKKFEEVGAPTAKYSVRRVVCKAVTVAAGLLEVTHEKLFSGQLQNRITVGMVLNEAFSGHPDHNAYNFQHFHLKEILFFADGQNVQNIKPPEMNYTGTQWIHAYNSLYSGTGRLFHDEGLAIERTEYSFGYALYAFDLSPYLTDDEKFELLHTGSVRLQLKFLQQLENPITIIIYA